MIVEKMATNVYKLYKLSSTREDINTPMVEISEGIVTNNWATKSRRITYTIEKGS